MDKYVIGIDYGTDSCRGILINAMTGVEICEKSFNYPRWANNLYCNEELSEYRQHPLDHLEGMEYILTGITKKVGKEIAENIVAISLDTTGSTICAIDEKGIPLALHDEFSDNPNAMFIMWKDHSAIKESEEINKVASIYEKEYGIDFTKYVGGTYSAEWFFSKILHILREDQGIRDNAVSYIEHCDYLVSYLTGVDNYKDIKRSRCAAGHKVMWNEKFEGLPSNDFLKKVDPLLDGLRDNLYDKTLTSDNIGGKINPKLAEKFGLPKDLVIGVGALDSHIGAVGGNIKAGTMVKVIGTSTCDMIIISKDDLKDKAVEGISGQVDGSIVPNYIGLEAGQSAFGDTYAWFKDILLYGLEDKSQGDNILEKLEKEADKYPPSRDNVLSLDWINGRRTPNANQNLKAAVMGIGLDTNPAKLYRNLIEANAFGSRAIMETFIEQGIPINEVIAIGGVAKKSPLNMQILADVMNTPIKVIESEQSVALGAAIFASVVGGIYKTVEEAQDVIASGIEAVYYPQEENVKIYNEIYKDYLKLGKFVETNL